MKKQFFMGALCIGVLSLLLTGCSGKIKARKDGTFNVDLKTFNSQYSETLDPDLEKVENYDAQPIKDTNPRMTVNVAKLDNGMDIRVWEYSESGKVFKVQLTNTVIDNTLLFSYADGLLRCFSGIKDEQIAGIIKDAKAAVSYKKAYEENVAGFTVQCHLIDGERASFYVKVERAR